MKRMIFAALLGLSSTLALASSGPVNPPGGGTGGDVPGSDTGNGGTTPGQGPDQGGGGTTPGQGPDQGGGGNGSMPNYPQIGGTFGNCTVVSFVSAGQDFQTVQDAQSACNTLTTSLGLQQGECSVDQALARGKLKIRRGRRAQSNGAQGAVQTLIQDLLGNNAFNLTNILGSLTGATLTSTTPAVIGLQASGNCQ